MRLKPGESLVSMTVLPPDLAQQVAAAQAAAKVEAAAAKEAAAAAKQASPAAAGGDSSDAAAAAEDATAADSSSSKHLQGPWLLLVTRFGSGKRVSVFDVSCKGRGIQGVIGIKLNPGGCGRGVGRRAWLVGGWAGGVRSLWLQWVERQGVSTMWCVCRYLRQGAQKTHGLHSLSSAASTMSFLHPPRCLSNTCMPTSPSHTQQVTA